MSLSYEQPLSYGGGFFVGFRSYSLEDYRAEFYFIYIEELLNLSYDITNNNN